MSRFYRAAWIFYLLLAMAGLGGLVLLERRIDLRLFVVPESWSLDPALGALAAAVLIGVWALLRRRSERARELERTLGALVGPLETPEVVALAIVSAIGEEVAFRGALQEWVGYWPAAALFALLHVGPGPAFRPWTLFAALGGLAFGALVELRQSALGAAIVAHFLVNVIQLRRIAALASAEPEPSQRGEPEQGERSR